MKISISPPPCPPLRSPLPLLPPLCIPILANLVRQDISLAARSSLSSGIITMPTNPAAVGRSFLELIWEWRRVQWSQNKLLGRKEGERI